MEELLLLINPIIDFLTNNPEGVTIAYFGSNASTSLSFDQQKQLAQIQAGGNAEASAMAGMGGGIGDIAAGVSGIAMGIIGGGQRRREQRAANLEHSRMKEKYSQLDTSNPYAQLENPYEDLTINKQAAEFQAQQEQQAMANTMQQMQGAAGGSGIAALAQAMANQQSRNLQRASADIGQQERQNMMTAAQFTARRDEQGVMAERQMKREQAETMYGMAQQRKAAADEARQKATEGLIGGIAQTAGGIAQVAAMSDRNLKTDIKFLRYSPSGLKIYSFKYKDIKFGKGLFEGVMSDEIPSYAVTKHKDGYDTVDYTKIDVNFKAI